MNTKNISFSGNTKLIKQSGFTLVELLITMAVAAIALTIAVPNFKSIASSNRIVTQINNFNGAIAFARSESIKRGLGVTITPTNSNDWTNGWLTTLTSDPTQVLNRVDAYSAGTTLVDTSVIPATTILFTTDGRIQTVNNLVFTLCNDNLTATSNPQDTSGRQLTISPTGSTYLDANFTCPVV